MATSATIPLSGFFHYQVDIASLPAASRPGAALRRWSAQHRLPAMAFSRDSNSFAEVFAGWSERGFSFAVRVSGRRRALLVNPQRPVSGDCVRLWIDCRGSREAHRATRFCHSFLVLPANRRNEPKPMVKQLIIPRASEEAPMCKPSLLRADAAVLADGYAVDCLLPASALTGYDPEEGDELGLAYHVHDTQFGDQWFPVSGRLPVEHDPSLWAVARLVG